MERKTENMKMQWDTVDLGPFDKLQDLVTVRVHDALTLQACLGF